MTDEKAVVETCRCVDCGFRFRLSENKPSEGSYLCMDCHEERLGSQLWHKPGHG